MNSPCATRLILVEDEPLVARAIERILPSTVHAAVAETVAGALQLVASEVPAHGLAVDVRLPDGSGLDVLEAWLAKYPDAPSVVMTASKRNRTIANRACLRRSRFLAKPFEPAEFEVFLLDVLAARWGVPREIATRFAAYIREHELTVSQASLLARFIEYRKRRRIASQLLISENTLKTRVRQLCYKLELSSLEEAYEELLG